MPPRALWTGAIAFGLVNVPVRVYPAVHEHRLQFHLVHEPDGGPIGYQKVCKLDGEPVDDDEVVKAYEQPKGTFVPLTDEDFAAVRVEGTRTIDLEDFVPYEQIDPTFFSHAYLVAPGDGAERPYALLVRAMEESGLAGIGKFVLRNRQHLGCLRVRDGVLTLEQMYFADEVDPPKKVAPSKLPKVEKRELDLALGLIESLSGDWKPDRYEDTYRKALAKLIAQKRKGRGARELAEPEEETAETPDLMEALRQSVERAGGGKRKPARKGKSKSARGRSRSRAKT